MANQYWGIDLGGTKIEGVVLGATDAPNPLCRIRVPTGADSGYQHVIGRISELVQAMKSEAGTEPARLGIGTPGVLDPRNSTIKNSNTTCLIGQPLQRDLEAMLGVPVTLANDANCFALAETRLGAGRGAETAFGVILGTGVGGGVVVGQRALYGCQGIAGEWGHNMLEPLGPECYCGRRGCVETILSGPFLEHFYFERSGKRRPLPEIAARRADDPHAGATMERLAIYFGRAIASVINILDPDVVVLGGGGSNIDLLYEEGVHETARHVFNNRLETRIVKNELGDSAGVFGAAMLVA